MENYVNVNTILFRKKVDCMRWTEASHYVWEFDYSMNVEQPISQPQRPSPVNTFRNQEWRTHVKVLKSNTPNTSVDTFIYLRLTWWGRDCDHWTKPLLTKKSEDDILKEYRLILNFHKNDRILQVRISLSGKYFWYMCIAK